VGADAALAADILRCANSAMYRRGAPVTALTQAITRIGAQQVMRLLLASGLATHAQAPGVLAVLRRLIWIEGLASAAVCQELARLRGLRTEEAFVLGLLHDFGRVVTATALEAIVGERHPVARWPLAAWAELVDRQHVAVGLALAGRWGLPPLVGQVIALHHGGEGRCDDPGLCEVVRVSDEVVALLMARSRVEAADLVRVAGLRGAAEREALERVLEQVPDFVAAFEAPTPPAGAAPAPAIEPAASALPEGARAIKLGVSLSVARRPRLFTADRIAPDGLSMVGDDPVPENRLLEARLYAEQPLSAWFLVRRCRPEGAGWRVDAQPFALSGPLREAWAALVAGSGGGTTA
jgi:HD-like signal output (HDOD) protein